MNITYIKAGSLYVKNIKLLNPVQTKQTSNQLGTSIKMLGGLLIRSPSQILKGGTIMDRSENQTIAVIGRPLDDGVGTLPCPRTDDILQEQYNRLRFSDILRELDRARNIRKLEELETTKKKKVRRKTIKRKKRKTTKKKKRKSRR